jgi:predicted PhzF superfamily epimerase YddE/YHI9
MSKMPLWIVVAFADRPLAGAPAVVAPLSEG